MKRFILFKNGKAAGFYESEKVARSRFLKVCEESDFESDCISLVDLEEDCKTIAEY